MATADIKVDMQEKAQPRSAMPAAAWVAIGALSALFLGTLGWAIGATAEWQQAKDMNVPENFRSFQKLTDPWTYGDILGPQIWGGLCETGVSQTPIDLAIPATVGDKAGAPMTLNWAEPGFKLDGEVVDSGHGTMQINFAAGGTLTKSTGEVYQLAQIHCHGPSEHLRDGRGSHIECHYVHLRDNQGATEIAVVGVFLNGNGNGNPLMQIMLDNAPAKLTSYSEMFEAEVYTKDDIPGADHSHRKLLGGAKNPGIPVQGIEPATMLPTNRRVATYSGSLTTPPCTEGVSWFVMTEDVTASAAQVVAFLDYVGNTEIAVNNRPVQPLNGRKVEFHSG
ncbi:unnamed protein product [Pedinophyceae sp. YPF-701]|nr:unnamed protein product [Pedinophyceae sp. YPF-701]CAG9465440.1 unnamed protein product [Pedinophyceae sp. YPF-701]